MRAWDAAFEAELVAEVTVVVAAGPGALAAWKRLLVGVGPHVERWASRNRHLVRWSLAGEDDVRSVLVAVLTRLSRDDHDNLRRFVASLPPREATEDDEQLRALAHLDRLALEAADDADGADDAAAGGAADGREAVAGRDARTGTPLRAWLLRLVGYAALDHVRERLGWSREGGNKRAVGTDASRLSSVPEPAGRPPITDYLTVRRLHAEVEAAVAELPEPMRGALGLWLEDEDFADIATRLDLADAAEARRLVRAAQARLRHRFRDQAAALR
ncbi:MAG: hypothetical protein H6709_13165 [Kofleriaceae bacterium]|nr:hypothetical protein [Kofleriaceae bacterium]MCB9573027.1 hypothetical protein [Kofleriaceae bacterium]